MAHETTLATITIKGSGSLNQAGRVWISTWMIEKANDLDGPDRFKFDDRFRMRLMDEGDFARAVIVLHGASLWERPVVKAVSKWLREHASYLRRHENAFSKAAYRVDSETTERMVSAHDYRIRDALRLN